MTKINTAIWLEIEQNTNKCNTDNDMKIQPKYWEPLKKKKKKKKKHMWPKALHKCDVIK